MHHASISRRSLLQASAALCAISLTPLPLKACGAAIPDGYAAWIRPRGPEGWTVTCASRHGTGNFLPVSAPATAARMAKDGSAPVGLARKMILSDFATKSGLPPKSLALRGGFVEGDGIRVPVSIWIDFA